MQGGGSVQRFDSDEFIKFLIDNRVVGFFDKPVTLKSGRTSNWYVNWRTVSNDVFLLDTLTDHLMSFVADVGIKHDVFYGVPEGATKLGILATYKWARMQMNFVPGSHSLPMGRGAPKEHGVPADRFFVGAPRGKVVVVEDVTTTGGSLLGALDRLREIKDAKVVAAVGLTNRMEKRDDGRSVEEAVNERGVPYFALSVATDFLPEAVTAFRPTAEIVSSIVGEFEKYGVKKLEL